MFKLQSNCFWLSGANQTFPIRISRGIGYRFWRQHLQRICWLIRSSKFLEIHFLENSIFRTYTFVNSFSLYHKNTARKLLPSSLRARFGHDTTHNAIHCTDLPDDGVREVWTERYELNVHTICDLKKCFFISNSYRLSSFSRMGAVSSKS